MKKHIKSLKKKLKIFSPKLKEECGVFGISNVQDASALTALGLHALQHRGQEGCGTSPCHLSLMVKNIILKKDLA